MKKRALFNLDPFGKISESLAASVTPRHVSEAIIRDGVKVLQARSVSVAVLSEDGKTLEVKKASVGKEPDEAPSLVSVKENVPIAEVVRAGKPLFFHSISSIGRAYKGIALGNISGRYAAAAYAPLFVGRKIFGAISIRFAEERTFSVEERKFILALTKQFALALDRARLYDKEKSHSKELDDQNKLLRSVIANVPGIVWETRGSRDKSTHKLTHISEYAREITGYKKEYWLRKPSLWQQIVHPSDKEKEEEKIREIYAKCKPGVIELRWIHKDGRTVVVETQLSPVIGPRGKVVGLRGVTIDVTARKVLEAELVEKESRFRALIENSTDAIVLIDASGKVLYGSGSNYPILGLSPEELSTANFLTLVYPDDLLRMQRDFMHFESQPGAVVTSEARVLHKDGTWRWVRGTACNMLDNKTVNAIVINFRDISARKQVEEELNMRLRQQKAVAELGAKALTNIGLDELMNEALLQLCLVFGLEHAKILEYIPESNEFVYRAGRGWREGVVGRARVPANTRGGRRDFESFLRGETVLKTNLKKSDIDYDPILTEHNITTAATVTIKGEQRPYGLLGVCSRNARIFNDDDINFISTVANILASAIENRRHEERKDTFIGMASHELKTPITSLKLYGELLEPLAKNKQSKEYLKKMSTQVDKLTLLIDDILNISRIQAGKLELRMSPFDPDEMVRDVLTLVERTYVREPSLSLKINGHIRQEVVGDRDRLGQVMINLLSNAIKFTPKDGEIVVSLKKDKKFIDISVRDNGVGISPDDREKIFDRFYQVGTDRGGKSMGLGIGLFIAREIVQRHGGSLTVESDLGKGSTFIARLPLVAKSESSNESR